MILINKTLYNGNNPLQGIIYHYFTPEVASSTQYKNSVLNSPITNLRSPSTNCWASEKQKNSWFRYDFSSNSYYAIEMTHYTIKTHGGWHFPTKWEIRCSNDLNNWIPLHISKDGDAFTQIYENKTFPVSIRKICRYITYYDIGPNEKNNYYTNIWAFEVFGKLYYTAESYFPYTPSNAFLLYFLLIETINIILIK